MRHAIKVKSNIGTIPFVPYAVVASYGRVDLLPCTYADLVERSLVMKEALDIERQKKPDLLKGYDPLALAVFDMAKSVAKTRFRASKRIDVLKDERAMHYGPHAQTVIRWVIDPVSDMFRATIWVHLETPDGEAQPEFTYHKNAQDAIDAHVREGLPLPVTGYRACYDNIGSSPYTLEKNTHLSASLKKEQLYSMEDAESIFSEFQNAEFLKTVKRQVENDPLVKSAGMMDLVNYDGKVVGEVHKLPFYAWALRMMGKRSKTPLDVRIYEAKSYSGMKIPNDCPYHSDWMIAGGFDLEKDYDSRSEVCQASMSMAQQIQYAIFNTEHMVLATGKKVHGFIRHCTPDNADTIVRGDIVIIPKAGPEYQLHVERACADGVGGVIAINGSKAVHLAVVSREMGVTMMRVDNAFEVFPEHTFVEMDPEHGTIKAVPNDFMPKFKGGSRA